jgi:hypothetical protein
MNGRFGDFELSTSRNQISFKYENNKGNMRQPLPRRKDIFELFNRVRDVYRACSGNDALINTISFSGVRLDDNVFDCFLEVCHSYTILLRYKFRDCYC